MLSDISWKEYWLFSVIALLFYYGFIAIIFYKKELIGLLIGKKVLANPSLIRSTPASLMGTVQEDVPEERDQEPETTEETVSQEKLLFDDSYKIDDYYSNEASQAEAFDRLEELSGKLKALMEKSGTKINRAELMEKIRHELSVFSSLLQEDAFTNALNHFICMHAKELCRIELNDSELNGIWKNLKSK